jgi:hypothetical protein
MMAQTNGLPSLDVPRLPARWDTAFTVHTGAGFKDNVTLASQDPSSSAFLAAGLQALVNRLCLDGSQLNFFVDGNHRQYLSGPVDQEEDLSAFFEWKNPWGRRWESAVAAQCLYLDQVMDVSFSETNRDAVRVRGPSLTARAGLELDLTSQFWIGLEAPVTRRYLDEPLDNQWEGSTRLRLAFDYGHRSEISLGYEPLYRVYDEATQVAADGTPLPGTERAYLQQEVRLSWRHHWDAPRRWRTAVKLGAKLNEDNGSGYFDYTKWFGGLEVRFRAGRWELAAEARGARYLYPVQTVSATDLRKRDSTVAGLSLRCEYVLAKWLRLVAEYEYEKVFSNDEFETYTVNTVSGGLSWEF